MIVPGRQTEADSLSMWTRWFSGLHFQVGNRQLGDSSRSFQTVGRGNLPMSGRLSASCRTSGRRGLCAASRKLSSMAVLVSFVWACVLMPRLIIFIHGPSRCHVSARAGHWANPAAERRSRPGYGRHLDKDPGWPSPDDGQQARVEFCAAGSAPLAKLNLLLP